MKAVHTLAVLLTLVSAAFLTAGENGTSSAQDATKLCAKIASEPTGIPVNPDLPDWVTVPDAEFCEQNFENAVGTQLQRSRLAWQFFARLNQQVKEPDGGGGQTFSAWELWASDPDTFPGKDGGEPSGPPTSRKGPSISATAKLGIKGQEVTRNSVAYDYIVERLLYRAGAAEEILGTPTDNGSPRIDFCVGSIETKAQWINQQECEEQGYGRTFPRDMYTIQGDGDAEYGLQALHIMVKIKSYPDGPRRLDDPSWFWTTFEYYNNPNRKYLIDFVTYPDTYPYEKQKALLKEAGLEGSRLAMPVQVPVFDSKTGETSTVPGNSYVCNGTQYRFVGPDPKNPDQIINVILGNSVLEAEFVDPAPEGSKNPFRGWNVSCHSCHYEASGNGESLTKTFHSVTGHVMLGNDTHGQTLYPLDFEWSIPLLD